MDYDTSDVVYALSQLGHQHGPRPGGGRGPGRAWRGIIEEVPALWCSWVVAAGRASGLSVPLRIKVNDVPIPLPGVRVGFGVRYYFRCPSCHRKCDAVYILAGRPACRKCHHLGYRSQSRRWSSVYRILAPLFDRDLTAPARYFVDDQLLRDELVEAQDTIKTRLLAILDGVSVEYGDDQVETT